MRRGALAVVGVSALLVACGADDAAIRDAAAPDASSPEVAALDATVDALSDARDVQKQRWDRMRPHGHDVLASMRVVAVYFGAADEGGAQSFDPFIQWLVGSDYWSLMAQYGVGPGALVGSVRLAVSDAFPPGSPPTITVDALDARLSALLRSAGDKDASADAEDASDAASPAIPDADAYVFFLPDGLNASFVGPDGTTYVTCRDAGGYHYPANVAPYAVIPPCASGRSALAISHELAEVATDPEANGWFAEASDAGDAGGEIADLCNHGVTVENWAVTQLWSNADGDCEPAL